jgi:hypothetical protein
LDNPSGGLQQALAAQRKMSGGYLSFEEPVKKCYRAVYRWVAGAEMIHESALAMIILGRRSGPAEGDWTEKSEKLTTKTDWSLRSVWWPGG